MEYPMAYVLTHFEAHLRGFLIEAARFRVGNAGPRRVSFTTYSRLHSCGCHPFLDHWSPIAANED